MAASDLVHEGREVSVSIRDLDVRYRVYSDERGVAAPGQTSRFRTRRSTHVHAIQGISVDLYTGEAVGIVGSNGSGKSTLLRCIAGLQPKAGGSVRVRGEAHLLGVNAALKGEVSGYRNVILGGLAMGLGQAEVEAKMDDVLEFSGLGEAINRPMRTYSSGMRARLAFSIATLRTPEILLIDEALAVGDKEFRRRSLERVREIQRSANAIVMVTHSLNEIRETCTRALWLDHGRIRADGDVEEVLETYESSVAD